MSVALIVFLAGELVALVWLVVEDQRAARARRRERDAHHRLDEAGRRWLEETAKRRGWS
ncbi:hypothetical protein GCM10027586_03840 [Kineococcus gypseus]|uniref:hypothetical protein n=1 Tax=Kineococcus gypseus TaxID=1637102 RepID=UPI003D7DB879